MEDTGAPVSATGGSARSQAVDADKERWHTRRGTAIAIRTFVLLLPFVASLVAGRLLAAAMPHPDGFAGSALWWGVVIVGSSLALISVDRAARRLLPIAALYRLALVFPDKAPSRYRVALRTGTAKQLRDRLEAGGDLGDTPSEAAENLLLLVSALGKHDRITRGHSERVRAYSDVIAGEMGLSDADRERLHWAALVHDVGKMAVRPEVLNKAGRPTDDEWQELRNHPEAAATMVEPLRPWLGDWVDAATQHHERVDGKGYPRALAGAEISLAGRIVAVADAYDCMTSARSYKKALPAEQARYELTRNSGTQFDPDVVRALLGVSVGRLHLAAGPLSWLAQIPGAREAITLSGAGGASVSAGVAAAAVTVAGAVSGFVTPAHSGEPVSAARVSAPIEATAPVAGDEIAVVTTTTIGAGGDAPAVTPPPRSEDGSPGPATTVRPGATTTTAGSSSGGTTTTVLAAGGTSGTTTTRAPDAATTTTRSPTTTTSTTTTSTTTTTIANNAPNAVNDSDSMSLLLTERYLSVLANDSDADGSLVPATLAIVAQPAADRGSAAVVGSQIRYTRGILTGNAVFSYRICDDDGACSQATVTINITLF